jgi:hypothetical protein
VGDNTRGGSQDGSDPLIASDEVTYSGDTADVQLTRPVHVEGSEGSKVVHAITNEFGHIIAPGGEIGVAGVGTVDSTFVGGPILNGGRASAAAPSSVDADDDLVAAWLLRNGAQVVALQSGGTLVALPTALGAGGGLKVDGSGSALPVSAASLPLPSGAATEAELDSQTALLTTIDADTGNLAGILTAVQLIDNMISGSEAQVDVVAALPAGSNNIGDVDVLTVPADPFGATADAAVAAGATGSISAKLRRISQSIEDLKTTALVAGTANIGDVDVLTLPALPAGNNNIGDVDIASALPAGTNAIGKLAANSGVDIGDVDVTSMPGVAGDVAHGTADSGAPVKTGYKASNAFPTAEANGDRVNGIADLFGRQLVTAIDPAMQVSKAFNATTTQTGTDVWDPGASKRIAVTALIIGTYGTTAARVILWFGDNADTTYTAGTDQVLAAASFAPSATAKPGLTLNFDPPIYCTTADRELHITTDAAISIDVTVHGFEW